MSSSLLHVVNCACAGDAPASACALNALAEWLLMLLSNRELVLELCTTVYKACACGSSLADFHLISER